MEIDVAETVSLYREIARRRGFGQEDSPSKLSREELLRDLERLLLLLGGIRV